MKDDAPRRSRLWLMRLLAVALSLTPLVVVEVIFRSVENPVVEAFDRDPLVDLSQLRPLFVRSDDRRDDVEGGDEAEAGSQADVDAEVDAGGRWEIPPSRMNFFRPDSFLAKKPHGLKRIFVLGGSTVQGRPYAIETAFSTWLRLRLEANQPETRFEVINCGGVSYASYRVAKILEEVLGHEPDAIVIYTGHNEFLEDREYAEVREMGALHRAVATVAGNLATARWIQRNFFETSASEQIVPEHLLSGEVDTRLDHAGGLDRYDRDERWRFRVEQHFETTLRRMVELVRAVDVPLILCSPASDLVRTPPFKVEMLPGLSEPHERALQTRWTQARDISMSEADRVRAAEDCLGIDPGHAGAHYLVGRQWFERGEAELARRHLEAARDNDVCPLRATSAIIQSVDRVAAEQQIPLVATPKLLDQRDFLGQLRPDRIPDPAFFVDHLHPSVSGHQRIAEAIAEVLVEMEWAPAGDAESEQRYERLVEQQLAGLDAGYFARGKQRLEGLRRWASGRAGTAESDATPGNP